MSLVLIDTEEFRRKVAGFVDSTNRPEAEDVAQSLRRTACDLVVILARHFNRDDMRAVTLWDRIGSAIESSLAKAGDGR